MMLRLITICFAFTACLLAAPAAEAPPPHRVFPASWVTALTFSPDGKTLVAVQSGTVQVWDVATGKLTHTLGGLDEVVSAVAFSPDGKTLAVGSEDGTGPMGDRYNVRFRDTTTWKRTPTVFRVKAAIRCLAYRPDGKALAAGGGDGALRLWSLPGGDSLAHFGIDSRSVTVVAFSPDGKLLATGVGGVVQLRDGATGRHVFTLPNGDGRHVFNSITALSFSPDGKRLASGGWDNVVRLWDVGTRKSTTVLAGHTSVVSSVAISPDGRTVASGDWDRSVRVWEVPGGKLAATYMLPGPVGAVAFSPDGKTLAAGGENMSVKLWDLPKHR